jgi:hypothetical protein
LFYSAFWRAMLRHCRFCHFNAAMTEHCPPCFTTNTKSNRIIALRLTRMRPVGIGIIAVVDISRSIEKAAMAEDCPPFQTVAPKADLPYHTLAPCYHL